MDVEKCFDKLWLESTAIALYEDGIINEFLNILHQENTNAIKVNDLLTERKLVKDVEMQGSVWGSINCKTTVDKTNQCMLKHDELKYQYKADNNIDIGVLGMVDDTFSI